MAALSPSAEVYAARRARVAVALARENAVLVLHGGNLRTRSNDTEFRFRPDSDFHYLTGLSEPGARLVMRANPEGQPELHLFVRPRDPEAETWAGRRIGPEGATAIYGATQAHATGEFSAELGKLIDGADTVYLPLGRDPKLDRTVIEAGKRLRRRNRWGETPPVRLGDAHEFLGEERMVKDAGALASLRKATTLTAAAHTEAMRRVRPGMHEYEIEALIEYEFRRQGSSGPGYASIVGGGDNATILHYIDNNDPLVDNEVLLVDAGCEWDYFTADITRSYPVGGSFTPAQRDLYEVILAANVLGIEKCVVGNDIDSIHMDCIRVLAQGMVDLKMLDASVDQIVEEELFNRYYMHRTSHWLGVDVHDAGKYTLARKPRPLKPGYVLTVEPGLYVRADDDQAPEGLRGLGIRIEDDVLITESGPEVLTADAPKSLADLAEVVGSAHR